MKNVVLNKKTIIIDFGKISTPYCGLAEVALNFSQALEKQKTELLEFVYIVPGPLMEEFQMRVSARSISPNYTGLNRLIYYLSGRRRQLCRLPKFDLYHYLHFYSPWGPEPDSVAPILLTVHDLHALERVRSAKRLKKKLKEVGYLAFISRFSQQEYKKYFSSSSAVSRVIKNGVKKPPVIDEAKSDIWKQKYQDYLFTFGGLKRKNIHSLLGMLQINSDKPLLCDLKLLVAGGVKQKYKKELLDEAGQRGVSEKLVFLGAVSEQEKFELFQACRAFVFPSLQEGFGLPVIEALRFGKPVFCSNKTSLPEVGGEMVYYWESFDPVDMSEVLQQGLRDNDKNTQEKVLLRKRYARTFDWDKNAQEYLEYYLNVLS